MRNWGYICLEDERHLTNARKSKPGNRHSAIRTDAKASENRKNRKATWTRCAKCVNSLKLRRHCSTLGQRNRCLRARWRASHPVSFLQFGKLELRQPDIDSIKIYGNRLPVSRVRR